MSELLECTGCGGLKRRESSYCPHCDAGLSRWRRWAARLLAVVGPSALLGSGFAPLPGCGGSQYTMVDAYGVPPCSAVPEAPQCTAMDAYGVPPLHDAGPDGGDAGE